MKKTSENNISLEKDKRQPETNKIKTDINKGYLLEYRIRRLLYYMGYFVKGGILIKTPIEGEADDITDLDVLGIQLTQNFCSNSIWADCKSGKAKPLERITWINGIKNYIKIDEIIFVKKNVRLNTKEFARNQGIQILDTKIIEKFEKIYGINKDDFQGTWDYETQIAAIKYFQDIEIYNKESMKRIVEFIKSSYWQFDNYKKVKKSITALKQLSDIINMPITSNQIIGTKWAIYESINLFLLATLNICKEIYCLDDDDRKVILSRNLTLGTLTERQKEDIVNASYRLTYSIIKSKFPDFNDKIVTPKYESKPPIYFESYYNFILRILNNPKMFFDILRFVDIILMEYDLKGKKIDEDKLRNMFVNFDELLNASKIVFHFICSITNISKDIFQILNAK